MLGLSKDDAGTICIIRSLSKLDSLYQSLWENALGIWILKGLLIFILICSKV